ncbi:MAG: XRE family transcriptional regulator, partial [Treponema sp.]|nr:XRE family transcriptional regulator [Treponema sp.]
MAVKRTPGERIVELCKTYSISREVLAERSGLNIELIRRIEEEGYIPDLAPLVKIARALGVRLGTLMDDQEKLGPVITRRGEAETTTRFVTGIPRDGKSEAADPNTSSKSISAAHSPGSPVRQGLSFKTLAAGKGGRHMEPFIVDIEPGAVQEKSTHEGEEFIHVL